MTGNTSMLSAASKPFSTSSRIVVKIACSRGKLSSSPRPPGSLGCGKKVLMCATLSTGVMCVVYVGHRLSRIVKTCNVFILRKKIGWRFRF